MDYSFVPSVSNVQIGGSIVPFGLHQEAVVSTMEVYPDGTDKLSPGVQICALIGEDQIEQRGYIFFESMYANTDDKRQKQHLEVMATLVHIANALGIADASIESALKQRKPQSIMQYAQVICDICQSRLNQARVDVFLQYQKKSSKNGELFTELPNTIRNGVYVVPATQGEWVKVQDAKGLRYHRKGNPSELHPFQRDAYFMNTPNGKVNTNQGSTAFEAEQPAQTNPQAQQPEFSFDPNQAYGSNADLPF